MTVNRTLKKKGCKKMKEKKLKQLFCVAYALLITYSNPKTKRERYLKEVAYLIYPGFNDELLNKGVVSKPVSGATLYKRFLKELRKEDGKDYVMKAFSVFVENLIPGESDDSIVIDDCWDIVFGDCTNYDEFDIEEDEDNLEEASHDSYLLWIEENFCEEIRDIIWLGVFETRLNELEKAYWA